MNCRLLLLTTFFLFSLSGIVLAENNSKKATYKEFIELKKRTTKYLLKNDPRFVQYINREIALTKKLSADSLTTNTYVLAISFYFRNRNSIQALKLIQEAEVYFKKRKKENNTAMLYTLLSGFYLRQHDYVLGESMSRKAVFLLKNEKGGVDYSLCLTNIGTALLEQKNYKEALFYFKKSIKQIKPSLRSNLLFRQIEVVTLSSISICYSNLNDLKNAKIYLQKAKVQIEKLPTADLDLVNARYLKAKMLVFENERDFENALITAIAGVEQSDRLPWYKLEFLNKTIRFFKRKNDTPNALKYALIKSEFSENTVANDQKEMLTITRINFQLAESEKINTLKTKTLELNAISWRKQRNLLLVIAAMILFISFLIWRNISLKSNKMKSENKRMSVEKQLAIEDLEKNKKELSTLTLKHAHANDILSSICTELESKKAEFKSEQLTTINKIIKKLRNNYSKEWWKEFELRFNAANSEITQILNQRFSNLTRNEKRLCTFLIMDLSTKEIANITGQSINSITMARIRLRKKLQLTNNSTPISDFLNRITE